MRNIYVHQNIQKTKELQANQKNISFKKDTLSMDVYISGKNKVDFDINCFAFKFQIVLIHL